MTPDQLFTPLTYEDAKRTLYDTFAAVGVTTTGWKPGFVMRTMIAAVAVIVVVFSELVSLIGKAAWLDFAEGQWLTWLARYVYGTERIAAAFASGVVTLDNSAGGGLYSDVQPGDLVVYNPDTGKAYRNTSVFTLSPGQVLTGVAIVAIEAGSASTSTAGTIVRFQTPYADCTVTNPLALVGADEESDLNLRLRSKEVLGARSAMGPEDAYNAAARRATLADGTPINVNRTKLRRDGKGNVYIYVAKATGAVTGTLDDPNSEIAAVDLEIQRTAAPLGITARSSAAVAHGLSYVGAIYVTDKKGFTDAEIQAKAEAALVRYFGAAPIGGYIVNSLQGAIYLDDIKAALRVLDTAFRIELVGASDVLLQPNQFATLSALTLSVSLQKQATLSSFYVS